MRSARGRRRTWRAARQAAELARYENRVGETPGGDGEGERWKREERRGETQRQQQAQQQQQQQQRSRSTTTNAKNMIMKEDIWSNRVATEIVSEDFQPATDASLHDERVTAVLKQRTLHLKFSQRDASAGMRPFWKVSIGVISKSCQEAFTLAEST